MTPFEVTIAQSVPAMVRFVRAMSRTGAKVSSSPKSVSSGRTMLFIVWLNPMYIARFQSFCEPFKFQFISSEKIKVNGDVETGA